MLKMASRTLAAVGRVWLPRGAMSRRPRSSPPVRRMLDDVPTPPTPGGQFHPPTWRASVSGKTRKPRSNRILGSLCDTLARPMSRIGAFFDVDRTLVACNTGRLFLRDLRRRGEISFLRALRALGWMAKYHL